MLKMEDDIRSHVFFRRAAKSAIEVFYFLPFLLESIKLLLVQACLRLDENKTTNGEAYEEAEPRQRLVLLTPIIFLAVNVCVSLEINRVEPDKLLRKTLLKEVKQKGGYY
jgi:hypothetical protein